METHERHHPARHRRRGPRRRRVLLALAGVVAVLLGAGGFAYAELDGNLHSVDVDSAIGRHRPPKAATGAENVLVLGSDSRSGANRKYGRDGGGARSDTAMVLHVARGHRSASLISIPRDTLVDRPACKEPDGAGTAPAASGVMFNSAYQTGGPACTVKTVEKMSGVRMDHFTEVDFTGFKKLVDALGGVEVDVPQNIDDPYSHLHVTRGRHRLGGEQALGLVRTRHGVGDGSDLGRIRLQQRFVTALAAQVHSAGLLTDPGRLYKAADTATGALTTDSGLGSLAKLTGFARSVSHLSGGSLHSATLPVRPAPGDPDRLVPDRAPADRMWNAVRHDRPLPPQHGGRSAGTTGGPAGHGPAADG